MLNLFSKVLDMSLTACVVIGIVLVLRVFLRNAPKIWSYVLWSAVLFRLLCPVSIESGLSVVPSGVGYTPEERAVEVYEAIAPGELPMAAYHAVGDALNGGLGTISVRLEPEKAEIIGTGGDYAKLMHPEVWVLVFSRLWPTGVALMAAYSLYSLMLLRRRLRGATHLRENIYRVEGLETAFVMGILRPKIYLPAGLSEQEEPYIICHERHHIRRGDHIVKLLAFAALCVHWFNPLVWLSFVLAGKDMEMSCDEAVMKSTGADIRADYSRSLLGLATGRRSIAATPLAFGEGDTKGRIKNVLKWKKPAVKVTILALIVCAAAVVLCISDPAQPVNTEQVARVYSQHLSLPEGSLTINEDEVSVTEKLIIGEGREDLFALLNSYTAKRIAALPTWKPRATYGEHAARLELKDGGYFELRSRYVNGFSFHPAHFREDEYDTTLAEYDNAGNLLACWKMEYDFDQPFRDWLMEQARGREAEHTARRGLAFEELEPGQTVYLNEDIVLTRDGSPVFYHVTYSRTGLTLQVGLRHEDGAEYANSFEGGSDTWTFQGLPSGRYTPFVRNVDMGYTGEVNATGVANFDLTSPEDYFQKSTPWPQENPDVAVTEPIRNTPEQGLYDAILDHHRSEKSGQYFCCADYVVLANEEGTRYNPVTGDDSKTLNYYLWVLYQEYLFTENGIKEMGGAHVPTNITLAEGGDGGWYLLDYWVPRDGSYYAEDIKAVFPGDSVNDALDSQKYIMMQKQDCYAQALEYAKTDSDVTMDVDAVISGLIDVVCADAENPVHPGIHPDEYWELLYYGDYTRDYCERHLYGMGLEGDGPAEIGLRERVMEILLGEWRND